jgi:hypothetical protein
MFYNEVGEGGGGGNNSLRNFDEFIIWSPKNNLHVLFVSQDKGIVIHFKTLFVSIWLQKFHLTEGSFVESLQMGTLKIICYYSLSVPR